MKTLLSTKLLEQEMFDYARKLDMDLSCVEFIKAQSIDFDLSRTSLATLDSAAFTSSNAVKHFLERRGAKKFLNGKKIFSVSGKTKADLEKAGINISVSGDNAEELAEKVIVQGEVKSVIHVCGNKSLNVLESKLTKAAIRYVPFVVYETVIQEQPRLKESFDAILFFSPSGIESLLMKNDIETNTLCCCIGETTASALKIRKPNVEVVVPVNPTPEAMIDAIAGYFTHQNLNRESTEK